MISGIVLTRMRLGTMALQNFIQDTQILQGLPCRVKPIRLVGQGDTDNFFMTEPQQKQALELFRKGNCTFYEGHSKSLEPNEEEFMLQHQN